jgi:HSP20 family protein
MRDIISSSESQNAVSTSPKTHDLRSLWNYFFDFNGLETGSLEPKIDVTDAKDAVKVVAEMPGIKEDNIDLKISDEGYLTISGEKKHSSEHKSDNNYFSEISYGMFKRTIPLPWDLDYNLADAEYDNGVLTVNIPKTQTEKQKYKKISLKKKTASDSGNV